MDMSAKDIDKLAGTKNAGFGDFLVDPEDGNEIITEIHVDSGEIDGKRFDKKIWEKWLPTGLLQGLNDTEAMEVAMGLEDIATKDIIILGDDVLSKYRAEFDRSRQKTIQATAILEKKYPEMAAEFKRLQAKQYKMFATKSLDYGTANISQGLPMDTQENIEWAKLGIVVRMNDKVNRLINLFKGKSTNPANESIQDTFEDLSVYGIIALIINSGKWGK